MPALSEAFCKNPDRSDGKSEWIDEGCRGLRLRLNADGSKSFSWMGRDPTGKVRRVTLGRHGDINLKQARSLADAQRRAAQSADVPPDTTRRARAAAAAGIGFEDLAELYLQEVTTTKRAPEHDRRHLRLAIERFGNRPVREIAAKEFLQFFESRLKVTTDKEGRKHGGNTAARRLQATVSAMLTWAVVRKKLLDSNPIARAPRVGTAEESRDRVMTDEELTKLLVVLTDNRATTVGANIRLALLLILQTCCRPEEAAGMRVSELVNLEGRNPEWHRPRGRMKGKEAHIVPLSTYAVETIKAAMKVSNNVARSTYVFGSARTGAAVARASLSKAMIRTLVPAAGIEPAKPHDCRRTALSLAARLGAPVPVLGMLLGHKAENTLPGVLGVYNRFAYLPERRDALDKIGEHLAGLLALA